MLPRQLTHYRDMLMICGGLMLFALFAAPNAAEAAYRWRDAEGHVHYTESPPPASARQADKVNLSGSVIETEKMPYAVREAAKNYPVVLFVSADCGNLCDSARTLLKKYGIPFSETSVDDEAGQEVFKKQVGGNPYLPSLTVGAQARRGYEEGSWKQLLESAGYPLKTAGKP